MNCPSSLSFPRNSVRTKLKVAVRVWPMKTLKLKL